MEVSERMRLPEQPPRVRVEWVLAATRVVLVGGALLALVLDPFEAARGWFAVNLLTWYLIFSIGILALVWAPTRFTSGWAMGLHVADLGIFTVLMVLTDGATSPFFVSLIFLLICATIRWQLAGTIWTAVAAMVAYAGASAYSVQFLERAEFATDTFVIRATYLAVVTLLLGYLAALQHQFLRELSRLASWPRTLSRDPRRVLSEVLSRAADLLNARRVLLVWDDPDDGRLHLAWMSDGELAWSQEPETAYGSLVLPSLEGRSFQTANAGDERGRIVTLTPRGFLRRYGRPLNERLRERFRMREVQSWPLEGELVRGRLFCLDKSRMPLDDLTIGQFVARLAASRLDSVYVLDRLSDAAALEERVRVARDLHDSLLQSQAGAALQLAAARRVLDRDPAAAMERLNDVQQQLEGGELEMRSFIRGLRPRPLHAVERVALSLRERLQELRHRLERQWDLRMALTLDPEVDTIPPDLADHIYRLVQEGAVNAARHADASVVRVELTFDAGGAAGQPNPAAAPGHVARGVRLTITDDGRGFPFAGTYDLEALATLDRGPLTLKERVAELRGDLTLTSSSEAGSRLCITVPMVPA